MRSGADLTPRLTFEVAGPRERIYFDPANTTAAVVTCGGLSPGLNDVIRGIVMELWHGYRVTEINGIRYGYEGLVQKHGHLPLKLRPETVSNIQSFGGTILGSSRGPQDINEMVDGLDGTWRRHPIRHWRRWHSEVRSGACCGDPAPRS